MFEEKSISNAARKAFITQPAMSQALTRLKKHFNDPLFIRTKIATIATKKANQIYENIIPSLFSIRNELKKLDKFNPKTSNTVFVVGMSNYYQTLILPKLLKSLKEKAPNIKVELIPLLITDATYSQLKLLNTGEANLLIGITGNYSPPFHSEPLINETQCFLARKEHPIFKEKNITADLISSYKFIVCTKNSGASWPGITDLQSKGYYPEIGLEVTDHLVIPYILEKTDMIYISWKNEALQYLQHFPFKIIDLANMSKIEIKYVWHQNTNNDPANLFLRELLNKLSFNSVNTIESIL
jgi:DNA-binding transcriptional LysR family regulator